MFLQNCSYKNRSTWVGWVVRLPLTTKKEMQTTQMLSLTRETENIVTQTDERPSEWRPSKHETARQSQPHGSREMTRDTRVTRKTLCKQSSCCFIRYVKIFLIRLCWLTHRHIHSQLPKTQRQTHNIFSRTKTDRDREKQTDIQTQYILSNRDTHTHNIFSHTNTVTDRDTKYSLTHTHT